MGHPILKGRSQEVTNFDDPELHAFIEDMKETMVHAGGVGLAAPQVYVPLRIVIFFVPEGRDGGPAVPLTVMINPVIKPASDEMAEDWEGCLSVPYLTGVVPRWTQIKYSYQDLDGSLRERSVEGFHARVVQHESDHLDGVLYPMRMIDIATLSFVDADDEQDDVAEDVEAEDSSDEGTGQETSSAEPGTPETAL